MTMRTAAVVLLVAALGGCSGKYILTIPDQVAPPGGHASAVLRLQQYEFGAIRRIIEDGPMRLSVAGLAEKGCFTDELGFSAASVPVPKEPGKYDLLVQMQNAQGHETSGTAPVYVWTRNSDIVAVDADSIDMSDTLQVARARKALSQIAADAHILYLTRRHAEDVHLVRAALTEAGYPDGPVLVWLRSYWHLVRTGRLSVPKIVTEANLVCDLARMRETFSGLKVGISASPAAIRAFAKAKMTPVVVGDAHVDGLRGLRRTSWSRLAAGGLKK